MLKRMAKMNPKQERFIGWLMTVKAEREPRTQSDLARELGCDPTILSAYKRDPDFLEAWNTRYLRTIGDPGSKMEIMSTLMQTATDADDPKHVQAAKAFFEIEGSLRPQKNQVDIKVTTSPSELSDSDLERLMSDKATDELSKRREAG